MSESWIGWPLFRKANESRTESVDWWKRGAFLGIYKEMDVCFKKSSWSPEYGLLIGVSGQSYYIPWGTFEQTQEEAKIHFPSFFKPTKGSFMKELLADIKGFIKANSNVIYWTAFGFLLDHFFLKGAFRQRLHDIVEGILKKVESQIKQ